MMAAAYAMRLYESLFVYNDRILFHDPLLRVGQLLCQCVSTGVPPPEQPDGGAFPFYRRYYWRRRLSPKPSPVPDRHHGRARGLLRLPRIAAVTLAQARLPPP